ncbi:UNVERIFIED_CONTAM: hypothetical protein K2H54_042321 [Gekko kuhli]
MMHVDHCRAVYRTTAPLSSISPTKHWPPRPRSHMGITFRGCPSSPLKCSGAPKVDFFFWFSICYLCDPDGRSSFAWLFVPFLPTVLCQPQTRFFPFLDVFFSAASPPLAKEKPLLFMARSFCFPVQRSAQHLMPLGPLGHKGSRPHKKMDEQAVV